MNQPELTITVEDRHIRLVLELAWKAAKEPTLIHLFSDSKRALRAVGEEVRTARETG